MTTTPFDPASFYDLAQELLANPKDESYLRTAISRAYYACFHVARLGCQRKWSWTPPPYGEHRGVVRKLREQRQLFLAAHLQTLLNFREHADYDVDRPVSEAICRQAIGIATTLLPRLRVL